jgi:putative SOS response-associated peptidase YedK
MCGRFAFFGNGFFGYESLHLPEPPHFESYNIAPSQNILAIRTSPDSDQPEYAMLHWGLVPFWSKESKTKFPLINARADGIEKKPSFRSPFKHRRCIIPASGFYEWVQLEGHKQPYFIRPVDSDYFALAGIWDHWQGEDGKVANSCAIITTEANTLMSKIHDRMPVILGKEILSTWLDGKTEQGVLLGMLGPYPDLLMESYPVSSKVNSPRNNGPECIARINLGEEKQ